MPTSQNGWSASPSLKLRPLVINGVAFVPGIRDDDDVETVFRYFWTEYDKRVERLENPGCWGFAYRDNRNDPNALSNHASGTATDGNAPKHPNGVPTYRTFTTEQIREIHKILAELDHCLRWGGDYSGTPDAMHAEVNTSPAMLRVVADRLRGDEDMPFTEQQLRAIVRDETAKVVAAALDAPLNVKEPKGDERFRGMSVRELFKKIATATGAVPKP